MMTITTQNKNPQGAKTIKRATKTQEEKKFSLTQLSLQIQTQNFPYF